MEIKFGDVVSFTARGRKYEGVVVRTRVKHHRKIERLLSNTSIQDRSLTHSWVAEITVDKTVWTVPCSRCSIVRKADQADIIIAQQQAQAVKSSVTNRIYERKKHNYENAKNNGILDLQPGQMIEVCFKNSGWVPRRFVRYTFSGGIIFMGANGRERRSNARWARTLNKGKLAESGVAATPSAQASSVEPTSTFIDPFAAGSEADVDVG